ncbi:placenta-specific protein 9 [Egretta garzetta]|nr:placenta-specific protein 9 [Egretta garzetta]
MVVKGQSQVPEHLCSGARVANQTDTQALAEKVSPGVSSGLKQEQDLTAAADPVSVLPGSLGRGHWCNEHDTIHERLDIIEEKVIKTVEHLESEVKSLLNIISETTSNIPIAPGTPLIDIFDGKYLVGYNPN